LLSQVAAVPPHTEEMPTEALSILVTKRIGIGGTPITTGHARIMAAIGNRFSVR